MSNTYAPDPLSTQEICINNHESKKLNKKQRQVKNFKANKKALITSEKKGQKNKL